MLSLDRGLPRALHPFLNEMKQRFTTEMIYTLCKPNFAQEQALATLKARGYLTAVCSNSIRNTVELMMDRAGLVRYFDVLISNEDVKHPKPDPEMYLAAMEGLGCAPDECLIIEDNENGIRAARASGGHLLIVDSVQDTNISNILRRITEVDDLRDNSQAA
jgi:HAD superfamily hydrolase (TIGR01509 family)